MSTGLPDILRYFLLALLWLFFLYAARMVLLDVRRTRRSDALADDGAPDAHRRARLRLRIVEPRTRRGQLIDLDNEIILGRSPACAVALDGDTFASSVHARIFLRDGVPFVEDLGSTNGTFVNDERIERATRLGRGDLLRVGGTVLEVRR